MTNGVFNKLRIGIIGGAGYTGGELLRVLVNHPYVQITSICSNSHAGTLIADVHTDLLGDTALRFTDKLSPEIDVLFLCVGHGDAKTFLNENLIPEHVRVIDLSQDFRWNKHTKLDERSFIYGLPELNRTQIQVAKNIANPGCFATCIQIGLLPLAANNLLRSEIHIHATTGSTGAGQSLAASSHFTWRNNNLSVYKAFEHQHLHEIKKSLAVAGPLKEDDRLNIHFVPQRGNFTRGIFSSMYIETNLSIEKAHQLYEDYYQHHPFTHISKKSIDLKQVVNTNKCILHLEKYGNKLLITSILDNLLKGASGQAVQNMNLLFGFDETMGLKLKGTAF